MSDLKIFTENIEPQAADQIDALMKQPAFKNCKVRIMPDVHAGAGCVIGFTADLGDKVIPNIVGVDIGCGMLTIKLNNKDIDFQKLDETIREFVPSGRNIHAGKIAEYDEILNLFCYRELKNANWFNRSIGTLGGGNHFIEVDEDENGYKYLIIHSGSRNLGKQVADYYQNLAVELMQGKDKLYELQEQLIIEYKAQGKRSQIQKAITELHQKFNPNPLDIPKELCYLTGSYREKYLHDMKICQKYAELNRNTMADMIISHMGFMEAERFQTIHNYIEHDTNLVRKGAISAKEGELLLIPINMRDGCILGRGKGNDDWNQSAPHGAGRLMSRSKAREIVILEEYREAMSGIFTTSVDSSTLDEAPMVYKPMNEIIGNIGDTVEIISVIKPVYNYKAGE